MRSAFDLTGKRILITGAAAGIGASAARICGSLGAALALVDVQPTEPLADELRADGIAATPFTCDVADRAAVEALAGSTGPVDGLVLSAAVCPFDDWMEPGWDEAFDRVMSVNLHGPIHLARAYLPGMIERRGGRIVMVGSVAGQIGGLIAAPHYVASKGGLHAFVKWLAKRGAPHGVLVNGVAPASIDTLMIQGQPVDTTRIPLGRKGQPDEVGWPIAFLCSDAASYVCGALLDVNGGVYMS